MLMNVRNVSLFLQRKPNYFSRDYKASAAHNFSHHNIFFLFIVSFIYHPLIIYTYSHLDSLHFKYLDLFFVFWGKGVDSVSASLLL